MSWDDFDAYGQPHEGHAAHVTRDGQVAISSSRAGMQLDHGYYADPDAMTGWVEPVTVPWSELIGWEARCSCGWVGPMWRRLNPDHQDPDEHSIDGTRTAEGLIRAAWLAHLSASSSAHHSDL